MTLLLHAGPVGATRDAPRMSEVLDRVRVPGRRADGLGSGRTASAAARHTALEETAAALVDTASGT